MVHAQSDLVEAAWSMCFSKMHVQTPGMVQHGRQVWPVVQRMLLANGLCKHDVYRIRSACNEQVAKLGMTSMLRGKLSLSAGIGYQATLIFRIVQGRALGQLFEVTLVKT